MKSEQRQCSDRDRIADAYELAMGDYLAQVRATKAALISPDIAAFMKVLEQEQATKKVYEDARRAFVRHREEHGC